jgi:hypothetical protein
MKSTDKKGQKIGLMYLYIIFVHNIKQSAMNSTFIFDIPVLYYYEFTLLLMDFFS